MLLEKQCVSLDIAKRLKELGLHQYQQGVRDCIGQVLKLRPFVDLTRDLRERRMIEARLDAWEEEIKRLKKHFNI